MEVFTFATHAQGFFNKLVNNEFVRVRVLGFGQKWNGFFDKFRAMEAALVEVDDDCIVVFLDGFDSLIKRDPQEALRIYRETYPQLPMLCSLEPAFFGEYITLRMFGGMANSGMYMGPASKIRQVLRMTLPLESECAGDDQRALNMVIQRGADVQIDRDRTIFYNLTYSERMDATFKCNCVFTSAPGEFSLRRLGRGLIEYSPFLWKELLVIVVLIVVVVIVIRQSIRRRSKSKND